MTHKKLILVMNMHEVRFYQATGLKFESLKNKWTAEEIMGHHHTKQEKRTGFYQKRGAPGHFFDPHSEVKALERQDFAKAIAGLLEKECQENKFDELILVAEPKMLGDLRKSLGSHAEKLVVKEIDKDLINSPLEQIKMTVLG